MILADADNTPVHVRRL